MRKLRHAIFAIALIISLSHTSFAITWANVQVVCPICKHKNTFMEPMSWGSYIYHDPSKFQYIYWPLTDSPVLHSCLQCHYTAFMWDFTQIKEDKLQQIKKMLAAQPFEGKYAKYTEIPMSKRLAIAEKVYAIVGEDDDWWCRFERVKGFHFAREGKEAEAAAARKKALSLAEKMLGNKQKQPSEKELYLITGGMKYLLKDNAGAIKDLEHALTIKHQNPELEKQKVENLDAYLSDVVKEFIKIIRDEENGKPGPVRPHGGARL